jgi:hypothetical protein
MPCSLASSQLLFKQLKEKTDALGDAATEAGETYVTAMACLCVITT